MPQAQDLWCLSIKQEEQMDYNKLSIKSNKKLYKKREAWILCYPDP